MKTTKLNFYLLFAGIGLFISLGMGIVMYAQYYGYIKTSYFDTLARVSTLVEEQYPVLHDTAKLKEGIAEDAGWFWETSRGLANIANSFGLAYIYYIERTDRGYVFLISSNINPERLLAPVWSENTPVPYGIDDAWDKQTVTYSKKPIVNEWGALVYSTWPIVENGRTAGLLGAAYDVSFVEAPRRRALAALFTSIIVSIVIVGALAFFGSRSVIVPIEVQQRIAREANERRQEIEKLAAALKDASDSKSAFLANISHEMRTPMNAIIGLSTVMLDGETVQGELRENLEIIHDSSVMLLDVINDILDINKLEAGTLKIVSAEYDLPDLINELSSQSLMRAEGRPIRFELLIDETLPLKLCGDELRIKQICNKLLDNAFKYTEKGSVSLSISCQRDMAYAWLTIAIRDTGIGIRPAGMDRLFSNYGQLDTKANRRSGGTGLGLAIVKRMAEMMGGTISAESEYGKGSIFTLRIIQQFGTGGQIGNAIMESLRNFRYSGDKRRQDQKLPRVRVPGTKALVVDDVPTTQMVARGLIQPCGMQVDCVSSGAEAIEIIRRAEEKYDIIFMDYMMPEMDGIEAARIIREEIGTMYARTVPIVVLTAADITGMEKTFLQNGFNDFLIKPLDIIRLDSVLTRWVRDVG
jgi:signal transduction histidine kinase/CheY-like chemotaxis protein